METVTRELIVKVAELVRPYVRRTPVVTVDRADFGLPPGSMTLKLEQLQHSGSFKVRGAFANLLLRDVPGAGVVAASGGNHGAAVAYAAHVLGVPARIFVPTVSSPAKTARIRSYGADLVVTGATYSDSVEASLDWATTSGALSVPAFDQPETIAGAATLAVELEQQSGPQRSGPQRSGPQRSGPRQPGQRQSAPGHADSTATVLAAVGGGGLLAGLAAWNRNTAWEDDPVDDHGADDHGADGHLRDDHATDDHSARLVGVEPEGAPTLTWALDAGEPVDAPTGSVAVDSLAPRRIGRHTFALLRHSVSRVVLVDDDDIRHAQSILWDRLRLVAEPGGCAAFAAVLSGKYDPGSDNDVSVVVSGANTTAVDFTR